MSHTRDIDNQEPLFQFDPYELSPAGILEGPSRHLTTPTKIGADHRRPFSSSNLSVDNIFLTEMSQDMNSSIDRKGKSVSKPLPIRTQAQLDGMHDVFDMSPSSGPSHLYSQPSPPMLSSFDFLQTPFNDIHHSLMSIDGKVVERDTGKGKAKEAAPTLPPLAFTPTEFQYGGTGWPSFEPMSPTSGPSSFGSSYEPMAEPKASTSQAPQENSTSSVPARPGVRRMPSRHRSFSNLSIHSTRSLPVPPHTKSRLGPSKGANSLARRLLRKRDDASGLNSIDGVVGDLDLSVGRGSCLTPWRMTKEPATSPTFPTLDLEVLQAYPPNYAALKVKGRSYSSPFPMSAMDYIPDLTAMDVFSPIRLETRDLFDEVLPRELRLQVFAALVTLHEAGYEKLVQDNEWSVMKATSSKNKWLGRDKGIRELVKLSRVSKSWKTLVFDGQLWADLNLHPFPKISPNLLSTIVQSGGPFIKRLDFTGHTLLQPSTLLELTDELCLSSEPTAEYLSFTQLTTVNLQGCSALSTRSLHHLLIRSPSLEKLCTKGLAAVTNTTCDIISTYCRRISSLDMSRCSNLDGEGICSLANAVLKRGERLPLKEVRLSGLRHVDDSMLAALGKAAPDLEILDLSCIRTLHNSALEAFVAYDGEDVDIEFVLLTPREAGRDPRDFTRFRRRLTRLRHLILSSCILLTDIACSHLAYAVPRLEFLELAGIGSEIKDEGLVRLLGTTPIIRRLDLEDASEITDHALAAITPSVQAGGLQGTPAMLEPGHALEHLVLSCVANVTDDAFYALIRGCTRLSVLEADGTRMSGLVLKDFVRTMRKRKVSDAYIVAIDCRSVGESLVKDLSNSTRPRLGRREYSAKKLAYFDARDGEDIKVGQDECDPRRVVLKSFYSWQTVDAVRAAREKKRKSTRRLPNDSTDSISAVEDASPVPRARWWSPSGRRVSGSNSPTVFDGTNDRDGCTIM